MLAALNFVLGASIRRLWALRTQRKTIERDVLVSFPNPLAPGSDIQIHVSWGTRLIVASKPCCSKGEEKKTELCRRSSTTTLFGEFPENSFGIIKDYVI